MAATNTDLFFSRRQQLIDVATFVPALHLQARLFSNDNQSLSTDAVYGRKLRTRQTTYCVDAAFNQSLSLTP